MAIDLDHKNELQWVKEGRVFSAQHGALTSPVAFETDLVRQTPDMMIRTAPGTVIVPLRAEVVTEATGAVSQCLISSSNNDPGTTNVTAYTPLNSNSRFVNVGSAVTAFITATGNTGTAPTGVVDLYRGYVEPDVDAITATAHFEQFLYAPLHPGPGLPAVIGDDTNINAWLIYVGVGATGTGYILAQWAEFTYAEFYAE